MATIKHGVEFYSNGCIWSYSPDFGGAIGLVRVKDESYLLRAVIGMKINVNSTHTAERIAIDLLMDPKANANLMRSGEAVWKYRNG